MLVWASVAHVLSNYRQASMMVAEAIANAGSVDEAIRLVQKAIHDSLA